MSVFEEYGAFNFHYSYLMYPDIVLLLNCTTLLDCYENEQYITKTCLFKYTENCTTNHKNFQIKILIFFIFLLKT